MREPTSHNQICGILGRVISSGNKRENIGYLALRNIMNGEVTLEKMKHIKCQININIYIMFVSFQVMELNPNGIMAASLPTAYKVSLSTPSSCGLLWYTGRVLA